MLLLLIYKSRFKAQAVFKWTQATIREEKWEGNIGSSPGRCPLWPRSLLCKYSRPVFSESDRPPLWSPPAALYSHSYRLRTHTDTQLSIHTTVCSIIHNAQTIVCMYPWTWHRSKGYRTPRPPCELALRRSRLPAGRHTASFYWRKDKQTALRTRTFNWRRP